MGPARSEAHARVDVTETPGLAIHPTGGLAGCAWVASCAAICHDLHTCATYILVAAMCPNNRSKFNVALGIEAQGFCLVKPHS